MRNGLKGAIAHGYTYVLIAICLIITQQPTVSSEELVNYEKNDCDRLYIVNDIDVYRLESYPRQGINTGRDKCFNKFQGPNNKKLKIYVYGVSIGSCGIFVNIYDGDEKMSNDPRWSLGCRSPGKTVFESFSSEVIVRLDKPVADSSSLYQFRIYITNENGPEVDLSEPSMSDGGASSGVIAGIGIGVGLVVVVIIVVVAIVCWRMMGKKEKYGNKSPAVFTTSTSNDPPVNGILKRTESKGRGSKRRNNRPAYGGHDNQAYRSSVDGDDYSSVNGAPSTESTRGGIDLHYEEEVARKEGRTSSHRSNRRRNDDSTSDDTGDSVFHNKAFVDDERSDRSLRVRPDRRRRDRDDSSDSYVSSSRGAVSYITDTTNRTRTDSPSRSTDERGSQSSTTDGAPGHFIKGDNARRSGRSRSHSRSSTQSAETRGGDSVHFENTLGGSRSRAARASSDRSSTTNGYRSTSGSQRGRSSHHHENNGYVSSNESSVTSKKVSRNPIPIKAGDGAKFEMATETTHRFTKRDGSVRKKVILDHDKETKTNTKDRAKDEFDSARVELIQKSKPNDNTHSLVRSSSEKRNTRLRNTTASRAETSSDTLSSHSDKRPRRDDRQNDRPRDDRCEERSKDSATRRSSYRESQSQDRRDRVGSTRSRKNSTSRSVRPSYKDDYDAGGQRHRSEQSHKHQEKTYSDYDSDHRSRRREKYDRNTGYDSDARKRHRDYDSDRGGRDRGYDSDTRRRHRDNIDRGGRDRGYDSDARKRHRDYDSDRGGRDRSQRRYDQSDRNYSDCESDHGRRRESTRRTRPRTDRNYIDYDSDDNSYRSSRHRHSQRQDHRAKYYSDEDLVDSRRQRGGSLSRKSRPRSQSYSRDSRR